MKPIQWLIQFIMGDWLPLLVFLQLLLLLLLRWIAYMYIIVCDHNIIVVPATMTFNISSMKRDK